MSNETTEKDSLIFSALNGENKIEYCLLFHKFLKCKSNEDAEEILETESTEDSFESVFRCCSCEISFYLISIIIFGGLLLKNIVTFSCVFI